MYHRRLPPVLVLAALFAVLLVKPVSADWQLAEHDTFNMNLYGLSHVSQHWTSLTTNDKLRYDWTAGIIPVDFMIMDAANFAQFEALQSYSCAVIHQSVTSGDYNWTVTSYGEWYVVWNNLGVVSTSVASDWYRYHWVQPTTTTTTSLPPGIPGFPWSAVVIGLVFATGIVLVRRRGRYSEEA